jgi:Zn-dependent M28 family amino/carboxypeptidase
MNQNIPIPKLTPTILTLAIAISACMQIANAPIQTFSGERAFEHVKKQVDFGSRTPGSEAHHQTIDWISSNLEQAGWEVELQETTQMGNPVKNIIGRRSTDEPYIIIGAHYDSRFTADRDPNPANQLLPVPGANDGASGVAVLLELGRVIPDNLPINTWLVFFDAEDNGNIPGWDWILGSRAFVEEINPKPEAVVIIDMIGDADLKVYMERNSDPTLSQEIWAQAAKIGYDDVFVPEIKYGILDDHSPFLDAGIPAALVIDFDYPYWHTINDTTDKVSGDSLQVIGDVLLAWLTLPRE